MSHFSFSTQIYGDGWINECTFKNDFVLDASEIFKYECYFKTLVWKYHPVSQEEKE